MKTLEVRCCCDANKVLGHMTHAKLQQPGDVCFFQLLDAATPQDAGLGFPDGSFIRRELLLSVSEVLFCDGRSEPAVKNADYSLEDLVRLPGFVPLKG